MQTTRYPVTVYRSTDPNAPRLDHTPNCLLTILKACLVTGYGEKQGAGWSMPFESDDKKVLRPALSPYTDFYLKLSNDNGRQMTPQVYINMTDMDHGELKLQLDTPFTTVTHDDVVSNAWLVIACERGFWLLTSPNNKRGFFLYCGDTMINSLGNRGVWLGHSSGVAQYIGWAHASLLDNDLGYADSRKSPPKLYNPHTNNVSIGYAYGVFDGSSRRSTNIMMSNVLVMADSEAWVLPAFSPSVNTLSNLSQVDASGMALINHATGSGVDNNMLFRTDFWEL